MLLYLKLLNSLVFSGDIRLGRVWITIYQSSKKLLGTITLSQLFKWECRIQKKFWHIWSLIIKSYTCFVKGNKESEIKKIIRLSECGIFFDDNNIEKITESIIEYLANKKAIEKKKIVTENFLKENFSQKKVLLDFKKSINNI